jgi:hypothetical protein
MQTLISIIFPTAHTICSLNIPVVIATFGFWGELLHMEQILQPNRKVGATRYTQAELHISSANQPWGIQ